MSTGYVPQHKIPMLSFKQITIVDRCAPTPAGLSANCPPVTHDMWEGSRFPSFKREITCFFFVVGFWREYDVHKFSPNSPERNGWIVLKYVESFYTHIRLFMNIYAHKHAHGFRKYTHISHISAKNRLCKDVHIHMYIEVCIYILYVYLYIYTYSFLYVYIYVCIYISVSI